jgi:hypothetical protein
MAPRPWRPLAELEGALARGDLRYAVTLAEELRAQRARPIPLDLAARFLPLIALHSPGEYDSWARRWLIRWLAEHEEARIRQAAEIAGILADLPREPAAAGALDSLLALRTGAGPQRASSRSRSSA